MPPPSTTRIATKPKPKEKSKHSEAFVSKDADFPDVPESQSQSQPSQSIMQEEDGETNLGESNPTSPVRGEKEKGSVQRSEPFSNQINDSEQQQGDINPFEVRVQHIVEVFNNSLAYRRSF